MNTSYCNRCDTTKPLEDFYKNKHTTDGASCLCKICHSKDVNKKHDRGSYAYNRYDRECRTRYGISLQIVELQLIAQKGLCGCCHSPIEEPNKKSLHSRMHIDHNHTTGEVRSLLCHRCNLGIGFIEKIGINTIQTYLRQYARNKLTL